MSLDKEKAFEVRPSSPSLCHKRELTLAVSGRSVDVGRRVEVVLASPAPAHGGKHDALVVIGTGGRRSARSAHLACWEETVPDW